MSVIITWENNLLEKISKKFGKILMRCCRSDWQFGKNVFKHVSLCQLSLPVLVSKILGRGSQKKIRGDFVLSSVFLN